MDQTTRQTTSRREPGHADELCNAQLKRASTASAFSAHPIGYQSGFGCEFASEALPGALPVGRNSPQRAPYGLYAEQFSSSRARPLPLPVLKIVALGGIGCARLQCTGPSRRWGTANWSVISRVYPRLRQTSYVGIRFQCQVHRLILSMVS